MGLDEMGRLNWIYYLTLTVSKLSRRLSIQCSSELGQIFHPCPVHRRLDMLPSYNLATE